ncbi:MAG: zinc ABC transporter substrate-binding protein [Thermoguttaceae bacterium]|nr:zinc ABC transporter substrate-binding protein [Thermoguttaceae bacterium]
MKKLIGFLTIAMLTVCGFTGCRPGPKPESADALQIVVTIFPEYDWVRNILGNNPAGAEVTMLLDSGVDLHSYQPTAEDMMKIANSDLFVYVGGESDEWVDGVLRGTPNEKRITVNLLEALGDRAKEEEIVEGMEEDGDHDHHDHDADEEHHDGEEEGPEYDEHVWLSLRNAVVLVDRLAQALAGADPANAETYARNAVSYTEKLKALDAEYQATVDNAPVKTLLFGDRFPFRYLTDDYGLDYYAAFVGCSAETEASFETITFLARKADELSLHAVMTIEGANHKIAETIVQNTKSKDQRILSLDSMQSVTAEGAQSGAGYLPVMEKNLAVLKDALQ